MLLKRYLLSTLLGLVLHGPAGAAEFDPALLQVASVSALVAPVGADEPEFAKRADWVMPIASVTKLMTALVVMESGAPLDEWLDIVERHTPAAANAYTRIRTGSSATRRDLLHLALMSSENYAAYQLAWHHPDGFDAFISAMNAKAKELGMSNSRFVDPTGLSDANVSTARDLLKLANAAYQHGTIRELSTSPGAWMRFKNPGYGLQYGNTNPLVRSSRWNVLLSKTGYLDAAGRCLVMITEVAGEPRVMVMLDSLGTRTPIGDAGRMRRWLESGSRSEIARAAVEYEKQRVAARALATADVSLPEAASDGPVATTVSRQPSKATQN